MSHVFVFDEENVQIVDLSDLAKPGAQIAIRVTPNARQDRVVVGDLAKGEPIKVMVTVVAEDGKATAQAQALLAKALGVAKTRLVLLRGVKSRDKLFQLD